MQLQDYDVSTRYQAKVLRSERITPEQSKEEVRDILFEIHAADFNPQVGQNIGVLAPGRPEMGQDHHFRLYSIASLPADDSASSRQVGICVRRCHYVDDFSGEQYPGVASNYLCDLRPGDSFTITGPYGQAFEIPEDLSANLILIGAGTGIAPFRAFVQHLYRTEPDYSGRVLLFHGAQTGLELLYRNDARNDFALYYDKATFEAINALSKRPGWTDVSDWETALQSRSEELVRLLDQPNTYVYVAGLTKIRDELDHALAQVVGSPADWADLKQRLEYEDRWTELLFD